VLADQAEFMRLVAAIVGDDAASALKMVAATPELATMAAQVGATRQAAVPFYYLPIEHYLYAGDTALHMAAAGYRLPIAKSLIAAGADVSTTNRRGAQPLHYAVDGNPDAATWNPAVQGAMVSYLIKSGADPNATDRGGVTPLHRAVRNRCGAAVKALLDGGAEPQRPNNSGSTPMKLATQSTGRGGSGSAEAKAQQQEIMQLLESSGAHPYPR
jgi:ankyrin repeat protein